MVVRAVLLLLVLGAPALARADDLPVPFPATDLAGPRALAMGGALRASGTSNDAIFLNPAALMAVQRYGISGQGLHDFNDQAESFGLSVMDSTAGPVAAGLAWNRLILGPSGSRTTANMYNLALATTISDAVLVGASGKLIHINEGGVIHTVITPDVGVLIKADPVELGFAAYNLVNVATILAPARQYAAGVNVQLPHSLKVEGDIVFDTTTNPDTTLKFEAGAEWEVISILALRGGYTEDRILNQRAVSGGVGVLVPPGFGVDVGYRHDLIGTNPLRLIMVGIDVAM